MAHCGALTFPERGRAERLEFPSSATQNLPDAVEISVTSQLLNPHVLPSCAPWTAERLGTVQRRPPVISLWTLCSEVMNSSTAPRVSLHGSGNPRARPWLGIPEASPTQLCWDLPCPPLSPCSGNPRARPWLGIPEASPMQLCWDLPCPQTHLG